jgi:hypothetical protein
MNQRSCYDAVSKRHMGIPQRGAGQDAPRHEYSLLLHTLFFLFGTIEGLISPQFTHCVISSGDDCPCPTVHLARRPDIPPRTGLTVQVPAQAKRHTVLDFQAQILGVSFRRFGIQLNQGGLT